MANSRAEKLKPFLQNVNVQRFLDYISAAEATTEHGYRTNFGGSRIEDLSSHPRESRPFTNTKGEKKTSSAAGRYQIMPATYDDVAPKLGISEFQPIDQDLIALELIRRKGVLDDVASGDFKKAIESLGSTWAGFPSSKYPQRHWSWDRTNVWFATHGEPLGDASDSQPQPADREPLSDASGSDPQPAEGTETGMVALANDSNVKLERQAEAAGIPLETLRRIRLAAAMEDPLATQDLLEGGILPELGGEGSTQSILDVLSEPLVQKALDGDASNAQGEAIAKILGEDFVPDMALPSVLNKEIGRIVAEL